MSREKLTISEKVHKAMETHGLAQREVADRIGQLLGTPYSASSLNRAMRRNAMQPRFLRLLDSLIAASHAKEATTYLHGAQVRSGLTRSTDEAYYVLRLIRILRSDHELAKSAVCQNLEAFHELIELDEREKK